MDVSDTASIGARMGGVRNHCMRHHRQRCSVHRPGGGIACGCGTSSTVQHRLQPTLGLGESLRWHGSPKTWTQCCQFPLASHAGMPGKLNGKMEAPSSLGRSSSGTRTAASCKITTMNSKALTCTKSGEEDGVRFAPSTSFLLHTMSNQKRSPSQQAPPPQ